MPLDIPVVFYWCDELRWVLKTLRWDQPARLTISLLRAFPNLQEERQHTCTRFQHTFGGSVRAAARLGSWLCIWQAPCLCVSDESWEAASAPCPTRYRRSESLQEEGWLVVCYGPGQLPVVASAAVLMFLILPVKWSASNWGRKKNDRLNLLIFILLLGLPSIPPPRFIMNLPCLQPENWTNVVYLSF